MEAVVAVVALIGAVSILVYRRRRMEKEYIRALGGRWDNDPEMDELVADWEESEK